MAEYTVIRPQPEDQYHDYMAEVTAANQARRENPKSFKTLDVNAPQFSEQAEMVRQTKAINKANKSPQDESYYVIPPQPTDQYQIVPPEGSQAPSRGTPAATRIPGFEGIKDALTPRTTMQDILSPSYLGSVALGGTAGFALGGPPGAVVGGLGAMAAHETYLRELDKWKAKGYNTPGEAEWRAGLSSGMLGAVDMMAVPHQPQGVGGAYSAGEFARRNTAPPPEPPNPLNTTQTRQLYPGGEWSPPGGQATPVPPTPPVQAPKGQPQPPPPDVLTPPSFTRNVTEAQPPLLPSPLAPKGGSTFQQPVQPPMAPPLEMAARAQGKTVVPPTPQEVSQATKTITVPPEPVLGTEPIAKVAPKWKRWWEEQVRFRFGMDRHVVEAIPESPVITAVETVPVANETKLQALMEDTPWVKKILHPKGVSPLKQWLSRKAVREEDEVWLDAEQRAVDIWKQGGKTQGAYDAAIKSLSPELQEKIHFDDLMFEQVNAILKKRGEPLIPRWEGPYFIHRTTQEFKELRSVQGKGGAGLGSGMGGRRSERQFETQLEGEQVIGKKGYTSIRAAWLAKVYQDYNLIHLDQVMDALVHGGVLHRTKDAALAASPTGEPMRVSLGVFDPPGGWWVRTREEAQFLRQNMQPAKDQLHFTELANMFFRGPNLIIPYPHIVKNMGEKLLLTTIVNGKRVRDVPGDMLSWKHNTEPALIEEFKKVYPMSHTGKSAGQTIAEEIPQGVMSRASAALELLNKPSRNEIFARWDPAMRYAIWRGYVRQGMSYQEAANHTFLDLIRYGRRGYMEDLWKSIPMNMFIPWRVGVLSTLNKAFKTNPYKTLGVLGALDVLREWDYRNNTRFFHMPHDYLMTPALHATDGKYGDALETLVASAFAGPGGALAIRNIEMILEDMQGKGQSADIGKLLWGLKQVYDIGNSYEEFQRTGDVKPVADMIGLLLLGRHAAKYGAPPRLSQFIPESIMPKSAATQQAERKGRVARGEEPRGTGIPSMRIPQ